MAEAERWRALRRPNDQAMFLAAHVLARWIGRASTDGVAVAEVDLVQRCDRCAGPHGRPTSVVAGQAGPSVSFSHAGRLRRRGRGRPRPSAWTSSPWRRIDSTSPTVALSPDEQLQLEHRGGERRGATLLRWWVRKEARAQGDRRRSARSTRRHIEVSPPGSPAAVVAEVVPRAPGWRDLDARRRRLAATVAVAAALTHRTSTLSRWRW